MKLTHTREPDFKTYDVEVDIEERIAKPFKELADSLSDLVIHENFLTNDDGTKLFAFVVVSPNHPEPRNPGDPPHTYYRITIEKLPREY